MRYFRDDALLRRAIGAALVLGLLGLWARHWRENASAYDSYDAANNLFHTFWFLAVVALIYVATSLLLTPRNATAEAAESLAQRDS